MANLSYATGTMTLCGAWNRDLANDLKKILDFQPNQYQEYYLNVKDDFVLDSKAPEATPFSGMGRWNIYNTLKEIGGNIMNDIKKQRKGFSIIAPIFQNLLKTMEEKNLTVEVSFTDKGDDSLTWSSTGFFSSKEGKLIYTDHSVDKC